MPWNFYSECNIGVTTRFLLEVKLGAPAPLARSMPRKSSGPKQKNVILKDCTEHSKRSMELKSGKQDWGMIHFVCVRYCECVFIRCFFCAFSKVFESTRILPLNCIRGSRIFRLGLRFGFFYFTCSTTRTWWSSSFFPSPRVFSIPGPSTCAWHAHHTLPDRPEGTGISRTRGCPTDRCTIQPRQTDPLMYNSRKWSLNLYHFPPSPQFEHWSRIPLSTLIWNFSGVNLRLKGGMSWQRYFMRVFMRG